MTLVETAVSIGSVIGAMASSYVLRAVGIVYLLLIAATLYVFAYVFTIVFLKESLQGAVEVIIFRIHNIFNVHLGLK